MRKKIVTLFLVLVLLFTMMSGSTVMASSSTPQDQLDNDLAAAYNEYTDSMGSLQRLSASDFDNMIRTLIRESRRLINTNGKLSSIKKLLKKLKLDNRADLNKKYTDIINEADKITAEYQTRLEEIVKDYKKYNLSHDSVLKKANEYLIYADSKAYLEKIKDKYNSSKGLISSVIGDALKLLILIKSK